MTEIGNLYIISAPSGAGKTTLVKNLVEDLPKITVSISHTTRAKRPTEMHGTNYFFIDEPKFIEMIEEGDFLEHATIFHHLYGTSRQGVQETLARGLDVILEIDWQGHQQIKIIFPETTSIFILPPSLDDLQQRLVKRQQDHPEIIKQRLFDVKETVSHIHEYDYVVINDEFSHALRDLKTIIEAGRLTSLRQTKKHRKLVAELCGEQF